VKERERDAQLKWLVSACGKSEGMRFEKAKGRTGEGRGGLQGLFRIGVAQVFVVLNMCVQQIEGT